MRFRRKWSWLIGALLSGWLFAVSSARAGSQEDAVLVLNVRRDGHYASLLAKRLEQFLDRRGPTSSAEGLSKARRESLDVDALRNLASERRATLILWADVETLTDGRASVEVHLFNVRRSESPPPEFGVCAVTALEEKLKDLSDVLLTKYDQAQHQVKSPPLSAVAQPLVRRAIVPETRPRWRLWLGIGAAVGGGISLVSAVTLSGLQGQPAGSGCEYTKYQHPTAQLWQGCHYSNVPLLATGYVVAAGLGVASYLSLDF